MAVALKVVGVFLGIVLVGTLVGMAMFYAADFAGASTDLAIGLEVIASFVVGFMLTGAAMSRW